VVKYYIRTTGERTLDESYNQIPYKKLVDKDHRYVAFFIEQLEKYGNEDMVFIEDDCVLCRNFKEKIEKVIAQYPNKVINFFQLPTREYFKTHESTEYLQNQCTYYPKGLTIRLARKMREILEKSPKIRTDVCEDLALKELKETHIKYRPCLVQHLNFDSLLNNKVGSKRTPFFIDYLEDLKLNYDNLSKNDIKKLEMKLFYHMIRYKKEKINKN